MAYVITDTCVSCGACAGGCPVGAISEGDGKTAELALVHVQQAQSRRLNLS